MQMAAFCAPQGKVWDTPKLSHILIQLRKGSNSWAATSVSC